MKTKRQLGLTFVEVIVTVAIVAVVVAVAVAATNAINESATDETNPVPPSQVPGSSNTCFTSCTGILEYQCGDNEFIGLCFGFWDCNAEQGIHECK